MFDGVFGLNVGDVLGTVRDVIVSREAAKSQTAIEQARLATAERAATALSQQSAVQDAVTQRYVVLGLVAVAAIAVFVLLARE